jgi:murein DD-endopeptidase MepM/ murein hydrolase activator NlpD
MHTSPALPRARRAAPLLALGLWAGALHAQESAPPRYINPMDIPLELSGNFMEPRSNHFHSGLDMRTQGREGIPVKAVADGWVSRIKISPWGYGKAVYIDHGNGHTSVYGHLSALVGNVAEACLDAHYRHKDYSIDVTYERGAVPVTQGQVIALSGNTGGSGGPHLHFEIRRTGDQHAIDPESVGFALKDKTPPEIIGVRIHPLTDTSLVGPYPAKALGLAAQGGGGRYALKPEAKPAAYGTVGLSLHTLDRYDNSSARFGVRHIELFVDSVPVFSTHFTEVDFNANRYCNAHMEYGLFKAQKMEYHHCFRLPNNKLRIYGREEAQGRIELAPGQDRHVRFVVTDANGNRSELTFMLHGATAAEAATWPAPEPDGSLFRYDATNVLQEEGVRLTIPPHMLYDDVYVRYQRRKGPARAITPLHVLHDPLTPIHGNCELVLDLPADLPEHLRSKALIVSIDDAGKVSPVGGRHADGKLIADVRAFGAYTAMVDTVPPTITNVDLRTDMKGRKSFNLKIADNLSGISTWRGTIDGKWVLLEYEPKTNTITHHFDKHTNAPGTKKFEVVVTDERGNTARYSSTFTH